jgi:pimeloyl-ACP methyl ester carboxylesterase
MAERGRLRPHIDGGPLAQAGPPLLFESGWVTHLTAHLDLFEYRAFLARLTRQWTVIRYDKPGCGLSDRDGVDLSFDSQVAAAMAVADAAGAARFAMFGASQGGQLAAAIAARHPDRVQALALYGTCADGADLAPPEVRESIVALVRAHWGIGSKLLTGIFMTDPSAADAEDFAVLGREARPPRLPRTCWRPTTGPVSVTCCRRSPRPPRCCTASRTARPGSNSAARWRR